MKKLFNYDFNTFAFYSLIAVSFATLLTFQNCGKVKFNRLSDDAIVPQSCGTITMTPPNGLYSSTNVTFEVVPGNGVTVTDIQWEFTKANSTLFTSTSNPVSHTFNGVGEGPGDYFANVQYIKSDGNGCQLTRSFQILLSDLCTDPSGISGPRTGFVGEETSPFSIGHEDCFNGNVSWDMDNDGTPEFGSLPVADQVTHIYNQPGTYTVRAIVTNSEDNSQTILTHEINIVYRSCVNPFNLQVVPHGQFVRFAKPATQCGTACKSMPRFCSNGVFTGDSTFTQNPATCPATPACVCENGAVNPPACNQCPTGQVLTNGVCIVPPTPPPPPPPPPVPVVYEWNIGDWGGCSATTCNTSGTETRSVTCRTTAGAPAADSACSQPKPQTTRPCSARACNACALPWGGSIGHGQSVPAFQASQVACGQTCQQQARACNDGVLNGSFTNQNCSVASCAVNGACGSANGQTFQTAPTTNLCNSGTASSVSSGAASFTWTCSGQGGGSNASCSALKKNFETASCGFSLTSSNWSGAPGQPSSSYGACDWSGPMTMGSSNLVEAIFFVGDYYDTSGPYGIHRLSNPNDWNVTATGCTVGGVVDPRDPRKIMSNYCKAAGRRAYSGTPLVWQATITLTHKTNGQIRSVPIKGTFQPTLNGGGSNPPPNPPPSGPPGGGGGGGGGGGPNNPGGPQNPL